MRNHADRRCGCRPRRRARVPATVEAVDAPARRAKHVETVAPPLVADTVSEMRSHASDRGVRALRERDARWR